jgi:ParB-like chromosome segregation protein Spo0J
MEFDKHPINNVEWVETSLLQANDYNPNNVANNEMDLLAYSIIKQGWIQPILITQENVIIDGFHRYTLAANNDEVRAITKGFIPCVRMTLSEPERMFLTIRINRAKGTHTAFKMHEIVKALIEDHGVNVSTICKEIGATKNEVEVLLMENVFKKLDIENHKYSKAWYPKRDTKRGANQ